MKRVAFIYDDIFLRHETPKWHPECKERLISILDIMKKSELWEILIHLKPKRATFDDIALAHEIDYIKKIRSFGKGYLDSDTYMSEDSLEVALYAAGAVMKAVDGCKAKEIERAFCAVRPPGHHAEADMAMGFCIFNNVAVGARYAQKIGYEKVFIIDFDVHHGNGTQHIFEEDDTVFYFSTHQYPHYPGTGKGSEKGRGKGEGYTYNIPMKAGSGDKEYLQVYQDILPQIVKEFEPEIILVSAGYDIRSEDPLSSIRISDEGIRGIVQAILSCSKVNEKVQEIPFIFVLEGGYDLEALGKSVKITIEEMMK